MPYVTRLAAMALLAALALPASAQIPRKDVLVCGFLDGSRFILTSRYSYNVLSLIAPIREHEHRKGWDIEYEDAKGRQSSPPSYVHYSGNHSNELRSVCTQAGGVRNGLAMVRFSYLQSSGEWFSKKGFPWDQMRIPSDEKDMRESKFGKAGFLVAPLLFAFIMPLNDGRLVFEHPLERSRSTTDRYYYEMRFDGVYQAFSADNGKTWSDPVITTDALIFQMGKRWIDQCFVARPIEFNGDKIAPDFPEPCPTNP